MHRESIPPILDQCPNWWINFIKENQIAGVSEVRAALAKYGGDVDIFPKMDGDDFQSVIFSDARDFVYFKLKYSGK